MFPGRTTKAVVVSVVSLLCGGATLAIASGTAGATSPTGPGASGNTITNAAQAQAPFSAGTFDSGQVIDVVVPANSVLSPNSQLFILECAAPGGVDPTTTASCDGNTNYAGGTIYVNGDGSVDIMNGSAPSGIGYKVYALPDQYSLAESPAGAPKCRLGSANECVLYIGQGGGGDIGMSQPHFFSQAFQVHSDPTDSGTLSPGDGTFRADAAPVITSVNGATFTEGTSGAFAVTATGYPAPTFSETGGLPSGVSLNSSTGVLAGAATTFGSYPITITATNGVTPNAAQAFTLTVQPGISGETIPGSASAQAPFSPGTFDSGQPINVVVPANGILTPGHQLYVMECAAPKGVLPTSTASCDGNSNYAGGTIYVNGDGSVDVTGGSAPSGLPFTLYALPDHYNLGEPAAGAPKCGLGSANECVLYIGQGGGGDIGMSQPHFFSQAFQVHSDPTDSGTLSPGDGTFGPDVAPAITSANHATFTQGTHGTFTVTGTGYGPPTFTETGTLPVGVSLNQITGVLSGTPTATGIFPITITASNGATPDATQAFTLTVNAAGTAPTITSANTATFTQYSVGSFTATATGYPVPTFADPGPLDGLSINATTGVLSGTPTATGTFTSTITASNGILPDATQVFTLTVLGFHITTSSLPDATPNLAYGPVTLQAIGATPGAAIKWKRLAALPKGIKLSSAGVLSGTANKKLVAGSNATVSVEVTEKYKVGKTKYSITATKNLNLHIA